MPEFCHLLLVEEYMNGIILLTLTVATVYLTVRTEMVRYLEGLDLEQA